MLRCQLYMFRTVTVHPQELLFRCCMCRLWYVLIRPASTTFEEELPQMLYQRFLPCTIVCTYNIYKEAPKDGLLQSETCRADTWASINNQCCYIVYLVGMYIYCKKMIHGPSNVKFIYLYTPSMYGYGTCASENFYDTADDSAPQCYVRSHWMVSKLTCCRAPIDICFTSSLNIKPKTDFAMWSQADLHASWATSGCKDTCILKYHTCCRTMYVDMNHLVKRQSWYTKQQEKDTCNVTIMCNI